MDNEMDEWLSECMDTYAEMTPIQRLEFREELDRLVASGHVIVIHGRKSDAHSYLVDRFIWLNEDRQGDA